LSVSGGKGRYNEPVGEKYSANRLFLSAKRMMSGPAAIEWPDLDIDLEIDSLRHPERYPLVIKRNAMDYV
jgi:hypothetical protein